MAKETYKETFGEAEAKPMRSPLSFQRTDSDSVDSIHDSRPEAGAFNSPPKDPAGFIPGESKEG